MRGWKKGRPRKLDTPIVSRRSIGLRQVDIDRLKVIADAFGLDGEPDAIRTAVEMAAQQLSEDSDTPEGDRR